MAQQFYRKPVAMGGGGNTFTGFAIPTKLVNTPNGAYAAAVNAQSVVLTGTPADASYTWAVTTTVTPDSLNSVIGTP
jgi:hypothetical protein